LLLIIESDPPTESEKDKIRGIKILLIACDAVFETADAILGTQ
jgi:hypothetical protein